MEGLKEEKLQKMTNLKESIDDIWRKQILLNIKVQTQDMLKLYPKVPCLPLYPSSLSFTIQLRDWCEV